MSMFDQVNTKSYSFKSSGTKLSLADVTPEDKPKPPLGIKTPMELGDNTGLFAMHTDPAKLVSDNLRNLIMTNHGERLGFYDFGADLKSLVFDLGHDAVDQEAIRRISRAVEKYMPFVVLANFRVFSDRLDNDKVAKVGIQITYKIPLIDDQVRSLELMLYVGG